MSKRRASGEGSIRKRSDGRWEGRYVAGHDEAGKPIRRNVLGKTQAEVKEKLKAAQYACILAVIAGIVIIGFTGD